MRGDSKTAVVFRNGLLVDGSSPESSGQVDVLVENGTVTAVSEGRIEAGNAAEYDLAGHGEHLLAIMKDGRFHKNALESHPEVM